MGANDPRLNNAQNIDFRLQRMFSGWKKKDPPPNRVKPVPIQVIRNILFVASNSNNALVQRTADMIVLAFYFLLRPGEYTASPSDTIPFDFKSVQLFLGGQRLDLTTSTDAQLQCSTFVSLTFTLQKNGVQGEVVGLGLSGDPMLCPVKAMIRIITQLRRSNASPNTLVSICQSQSSMAPSNPINDYKVHQASCPLPGSNPRLPRHRCVCPLPPSRWR